MRDERIARKGVDIHAYGVAGIDHTYLCCHPSLNGVVTDTDDGRCLCVGIWTLEAPDTRPLARRRPWQDNPARLKRLDHQRIRVDALIGEQELLAYRVRVHPTEHHEHEHDQCRNEKQRSYQPRGEPEIHPARVSLLKRCFGSRAGEFRLLLGEERGDPHTGIAAAEHRLKLFRFDGEAISEWLAETL